MAAVCDNGGMVAGVGESEKAIAAVFAKAKAVAPCVMFFDEVLLQICPAIIILCVRCQIQAVFGSRDKSGKFGQKLISQFILQLDSISHTTAHVLVAAFPAIFAANYH